MVNDKPNYLSEASKRYSIVDADVAKVTFGDVLKVVGVRKNSFKK